MASVQPVALPIWIVGGVGSVDSHARGPVGRAVAFALGLTSSRRQPVTFVIEEDGAAARWTRHFGGREISTAVCMIGDELVESIGPFSLWFTATDAPMGGQLTLVALGWRAHRFATRLGLRLTANVEANDDKACTSVAMSVPGLGVLRYRAELLSAGSGQ